MGTMEKAIKIQREARENVQNLRSYITDLGNWEREMKRREAAIKGDVEQKDLPPVRSKQNKEKPIAKVTEKKKPRIKSGDYLAWDKFDVDAACEEVDMCEVGPTSLDSKRSIPVKVDKLREEAQYEKDRGNAFVKQEKWDEAVECYNRAIELISNDAIYYANRGLCHLKRDRLHQAETDCTHAIKLDPSYVKAYQRRAAAREKLGSLRAASHDLERVIELEPANSAARKQLAALKQRMATKGGKFKSSPVTTPTGSKAITSPDSPKIIELPASPPQIEEISTKVYSSEETKSSKKMWPGPMGDGANTVEIIHKPPHLRSKKPLRQIKIEEINIGETEPKTNRKQMEIETITSSNHEQPQTISPLESSKLENGIIKELNETNKNVPNDNVESKNVRISNVDIDKLVAPNTCVQFTSDWNNFDGNEEATRAYLSLIAPQRLPTIFQNSLESGTLSDILATLSSKPDRFNDVKLYLHHLTQVKRFGALAMFLSERDKIAVQSLLKYCKESENCTEQELNDLRNKFEL